jgi:myosin VI
MVQKTVRGYLARKQHQPRFKGVAKINDIRRNMKQMEGIADQLKSERETMLKHMKDLEVQVDLAILKIKVEI